MKCEIDFRTLTTNAASIVAFPDGVIHGVGHNRYDWLVKTEDDVPAIAEKVYRCFVDVMLPYIQLNASVARIDYLLNSHLDKYVIHNNSTRPCKGIIAAYLLNKDLQALFDFYDIRILDWADFSQIEYQNLKKYFHPPIDNIKYSF